jgi:hypothetical protein
MPGWFSCAVVEDLPGGCGGPSDRGHDHDGGGHPESRAEPVTHAHPFDPSSIAGEACDSGHIDVSGRRVDQTVGT